MLRRIWSTQTRGWITTSTYELWSGFLGEDLGEREGVGELCLSPEPTFSSDDFTLLHTSQAEQRWESNYCGLRSSLGRTRDPSVLWYSLNRNVITPIPNELVSHENRKPHPLYCPVTSMTSSSELPPFSILWCPPGWVSAAPNRLELGLL